MLRSTLIPALALALTGCVTTDPYGGYGGGHDGGYYGGGSGGAYGGQAIVCESHSGNYRECATPFRGAPVLVNNLSSAPCVEGRTWGSRGAGMVWVSGGCRAQFADSWGGAQPGWPSADAPVGGGYALRCESEDGRQRDCRGAGGERYTLLRQLSQSPCIEGQTWGSRSGGVWVRGGCRGEFGPASGAWGQPVPGGYRSGQGITCSSEGGRYHACHWDPRMGRPYLLEQLSQDTCREGHSGGYDGGSQLWVNRGCRGRFAGR